MSLTDSNLLIDGALVPAEGGRTFASINPATEEVIGHVADATVADAERAMGAARRAFDETSWSTDREFRAHCLRQLSDAIKANLDEFRDLTVAEVGVPRMMTFGPALDGPIAVLDYYAGLAATCSQGESDSAANKRRRRRSASTAVECSR